MPATSRILANFLSNNVLPIPAENEALIALCTRYAGASPHERRSIISQQEQESIAAKQTVTDIFGYPFKTRLLIKLLKFKTELEVQKATDAYNMGTEGPKI